MSGDLGPSVRAAFRPDIQGLRAIAVMLVVVYHLWPTRLPGGYVGVDIFFVISGFLITAHLLSEVERSGTVSITRFWSRRIRRLLPAALLVLAAALLAAIIWMPQSLIQQTLREIGASAVYVENWVLAVDSVDYLASENLPSLVQHYWSLSVEEQFYVVWPLLLVGGLMLARPLSKLVRRTPWRARPVITVLLAAVFLVSLTYSIVLTSLSQPAAFFNTGVRAWEFAAGGLVACLLAGRLGTVLLEHPFFSRFGPALAWIGLAGILASALIISESSEFPGSIALLPVLSTVLVILLGRADGVFAPSRILKWAPIQRIGDWSYSIYLWHWPLIVIFPFVFHTGRTAIASVAILAVSIVLGGVTKRFVEDPVRLSPALSRRRWPAFSFAAGGAVILIALTTVHSQVVEAERVEASEWVQQQLVEDAPCFGANAMVPANACPDPFAVGDRADPAFAAADLDPEWCLTGKAEEWRSCEYGQLEAPERTIALVGDSHAAALVPAFVRFAEAADWKVVTFLREGCAAFSASPIDLPGREQSEVDACAAWSDRVTKELVASTEIEAVVYTGFSLRYSDPLVAPEGRLSAAAVLETWQQVMDSGKQVVSLRDVPNLDRVNIPNCLAVSQETTAPCAFDRATALVPDEVTAAADASDAVETIDLSDFFCDASRCYAVIGDVVVYADDNHVSGTFARTLASHLGERLTDVIGR